MKVEVVKLNYAFAGLSLVAVAASLLMLAAPLSSNLGVIFPVAVGGGLGFFFSTVGSVLLLNDRCRVGEFSHHGVVLADLEVLQLDIQTGGASLVAGSRGALESTRLRSVRLARLL